MGIVSVSEGTNQQMALIMDCSHSPTKTSKTSKTIYRDSNDLAFFPVWPGIVWPYRSDSDPLKSFEIQEWQCSIEYQQHLPSPFFSGLHLRFPRKRTTLRR